MNHFQCKSTHFMNHFWYKSTHFMKKQPYKEPCPVRGKWLVGKCYRNNVSEP